MATAWKRKQETFFRDALKQEDVSGSGLGTAIAALFSETGLEKDIPEIRGHSVTPATFAS